MLMRDIDGAITFQPLWNGFAELKRLNSFCALRAAVIDDMLGELPIHERPHNAGGAPGPSYSQLFEDDRDDTDC